MADKFSKLQLRELDSIGLAFTLVFTNAAYDQTTLDDPQHKFYVTYLGFWRWRVQDMLLNWTRAACELGSKEEASWLEFRG